MNTLMQETQDMRSQLASIVNSKDNTEQLNQKLTEERRFLDKELINLRAQLAVSHQTHLQAQEPLYLTSLPPSFGGTTRFHRQNDITDFQLSKRNLNQICLLRFRALRKVFSFTRLRCLELPDPSMFLVSKMQIFRYLTFVRIKESQCILPSK